MLQFFLTTNWTTEYADDKDFFDYEFDQLNGFILTADSADDGDFFDYELNELHELFITAEYADYGDILTTNLAN